jgi:hypothetical protein
MYLVLALVFEEYNKNKHAASWPPALALSNKTLEGLCILPGGAPTHRRWHFNSMHAITQGGIIKSNFAAATAAAAASASAAATNRNDRRFQIHRIETKEQ